MRAISLWQPWASAIALGIKTIETRSWATGYRGPIAIHAAKRWDRAQREFASEEHTLGRLPSRLPLGAVVAIAELTDCVLSEQLPFEISALEGRYGNYAPGRYAWILEEIRPLPEPVPFRGMQGIFMVPDRLLPSPADR